MRLKPCLFLNLTPSLFLKQAPSLLKYDAKRFFNACHAGFSQRHFLLLHHLLLLFMPPHGLMSLFYYSYTISHPTIFVTAKRQFMSGEYSTKFYTGRQGPEVQIFTFLRRVPLLYNFQ